MKLRNVFISNFQNYMGIQKDNEAIRNTVKFKPGSRLLFIFGQSFKGFVCPILSPIFSRRHINYFPCVICPLCSLRKRNAFCLIRTVVLIDSNALYDSI